MNWRDLPSLAALRAFEAAARTGSLTRAAKELNVTHAAIAQHVRSVEDLVGSPLLQRQGRGMAPTQAGRALAEPLTDGFTQIADAVRQVTVSAEDAPLAITVTPSFAENWLMPRLCYFWAKHPEITVAITPSTELSDLRRSGLDLAIRYGRGNWPGLDATFLASADYVVVGAPSLVGNRQTTCLSDLSDLPWLFETVHRETRLWAENNGLTHGCCQVKELPTLSMVLSAARAGAGLAIVSRALIEQDLAQGSLIDLLDAPQEGLGYYVVTKLGVQPAKLKTFVKWLRTA